MPNGALIVFLDHRGRFHVFVCAEREDVEAARQTGPSQGGKSLVFVWQLLIVPVVVGQQHVHDRTGDKDDDRREHDRQPESGEWRHRGLPENYLND